MNEQLRAQEKMAKDTCDLLTRQLLEATNAADAMREDGVDLALGHIKAVEKIASSKGVCIYNLGTGVGYSVLDVVKAFEKASGKEIKYEIVPRRPGDLATVYSDPTKATTAVLFSKQKRGAGK